MNSEPRLSRNAPEDCTGAEDHDTPGPRGFFGRFFGALTGAEDHRAELSDDAHRASANLGLGNLRRMRVDDVAVPRAEIVSAAETVSLTALVEMFRAHGFSRIPVYEDSLDSPLGMIHLKDLALKHGFGQQSAFELRPMLRPLLFAPPSMTIGVLLQQMQQKRIHMALVIDEFGGVDGLVTIEDLIEQVIGEIEDEHDPGQDGLWILEKPGQWLIRARAPLGDVAAETGLMLSDAEEGDDIDTLGGLIFALTERVPAQGEVVIHDSGAEFEIVEGDPRRIKSIRLRLPAARVADAAKAGIKPETGREAG